MYKISFLVLTSLLLVLFSCEAPSVVNENIQKELNNKKIRHIAHEDEELFGLVFSEVVINKLVTEGITPHVVDSINKLDGFSLVLIDNTNIEEQPIEIRQQMEMFIYNQERDLDLTATGNYIKSSVEPFYSCASAVVDNNSISSFWVIKISPVTVRRNFPEE